MRVVVSVLLITALLAACGGEDTEPVPRGVTLQLEQTRQDLQGRKFSVQAVNQDREDMRVERVELESGRLDKPARYNGPTTVFAGTAVNLTMEMPPLAGQDATTMDRYLEPGGDPVHADVTFNPNRCDVHVVAEDRTGGILPLRVESATFGSSQVYLRFDEPQEAQIFDYLAERCGFGKKQDPLNAP